MHCLRAGGDDALLEADDLLGAGLLLAVAAGHFNLDTVGVEEVADAAHHAHAAALGHTGQAGGELGDDLGLVGAQFVDIDFGRREFDTEVGAVAGFLDHGGNVQKCFGWNAADVEADAAQCRIALDDHCVHAEVGSAEGGRVATRAGAEHQHCTFAIGGTGCWCRSRCRRSGRRRFGRGVACGRSRHGLQGED